ncbi:rho-related GTP-binding protein RhoG-like isoform X2 [Myripristis murdjan]|uniref:rho-related GTP-binding protein RhoG-like isoform X2 n=1 Tax=Myripristis murdjan TaxID=586833 RepID=UPI001175D49B|nr:rho-related GTP-binding protein RhoG-like isoform X2 [Myripristis murdjan]
MESINCVVVGDSAVGKTYLLYTYITKVFPQEYIPGFSSTYSTQVSVDNRTVSLKLWDTAGKEEYERFRALTYHRADVIIICFSVACPLSYEAVKTKWHPEVTHHCPEVPVLLVGTKRDLRDSQVVLEKLGEQDQTVVTQQQGTALAREIHAVRYLECAAINQEGINEVFDEAMASLLFPLPLQSRKMSRCKMM